MKRILAGIVCVVMSLSAAAETDYRVLTTKASRFFDAREWASAQALYGLILDRYPEADTIYVNDIVASSLLGHREAASELLSRAMTAGLGFSRLMDGVRTVAFEIGHPDVYEDFLLRSQIDCPWLSRAIDAELLRYYMFRNNGELTVRYANKMLAGLPDSTDYLADLAQGYIMLGDGDKAVDTWKRILALDPDNYDTLLSIGNYCAITGERHEAATWLRRASDIRPTPYVTKRLSSLDPVEKKH